MLREVLRIIDRILPNDRKLTNPLVLSFRYWRRACAWVILGVAGTRVGAHNNMARAQPQVITPMRWNSIDIGLQSTVTLPYKSDDPLWTPEREFRLSPRFIFSRAWKLTSKYYVEVSGAINTSRLYYRTRNPIIGPPQQYVKFEDFYPGSYSGVTSIYLSWGVSLAHYAQYKSSRWWYKLCGGPLLIDKLIYDGEGTPLICTGGKYCFRPNYKGNSSRLMPGYHIGGAVEYAITKSFHLGLQYDFYHQVGSPSLFSETSYFEDINTGIEYNHYEVRTRPFSHSFGLRLSFLQELLQKKKRRR